MTYHKDDLGLILYYVKFNWINETPQLAALSIGMRDLNPSIQGVTIRNLEEQRYNSDFYNPANAAAGNFDFSLVLVFIFPLIIIAFCYNLISEEEESGHWKLLSVQCRSLARFIDCKFLVRVLAISIIYLLLIAIATIWIDIPMDKNFLYFILSGWLYLLFWFALCRFVISFRKSSAYNALILLTVWIGLNYIIPMGCNMAIQKIVPVKEGLKAVMEQREGYHNKWDEAKLPTMEKFYKASPQFKQFKINESDSFSWTWYYAMQHMGDLEVAASSEQYIAKMQKRNRAAVVLGYFFPNILFTLCHYHHIIYPLITKQHQKIMIKIDNLHKKYGNFTALQSLNLEIGSGEIYALLGQNGAGKSTTINILLGLIKASSGDAFINHISVTDQPQEIKKNLAYIPETVLLYPNLTGLENLDFFSKIAGFSYSKDALHDFLMHTGLQASAHDKALGGYSKGMRQKVGIAIALAKDAKVLLLDEPTSGLDPIATAEFTEIVRQLGQQGRTVLMATHDIFNAVSVATNIGIMKQGQLVQNLPSKAFTADELQELY